jgi:AcrR family transcriptional regulator
MSASVPGLRERKKQKTRWAIQEHALRLFAEQGYEATTVEQIAAAAEISPSTFFRYFKTKEDVVVEDHWDPLLIEAYRSAPSGLGPLATLRHAIRESFAQADRTELDKIMARMRLQWTVPALRARTLDGMLVSLDMIAGLLGERAGRDARDPMVLTAAGAVMGVLLSALVAWQEADSGEHLFAYMDEALAQLGELGLDG